MEMEKVFLQPRASFLSLWVISGRLFADAIVWILAVDFFPGASLEKGDGNVRTGQVLLLVGSDS